jgi:hypothetical protein
MEVGFGKGLYTHLNNKQGQMGDKCKGNLKGPISPI